MYNIHNHYNNIYSLAKSIAKNPQIIYLHPFGSTSIDNVEMISPISATPVDTSIICYDQEPIIAKFNRKLIGPLWERIWNADNAILLNTELDSSEKKKLIALFPSLKDCYYFHHAFTASDWYRGYQYDTDLTLPSTRVINKKFITFNRITSNARIYRSLIVNELIEHNILNQGHVSFNTVCPDGLHYADELYSYGSYVGLPEALIEKTIKNIDSLDAPLRIDFKEEACIPNNSFHINAIAENMESFVHVVTETCYWGRKKHLTEKIFKPIVMRQPFILVGCAHNLEYLKSYGFKTFDRWWDESYDQIEDDVERIHAIGNLLADICKNDLSKLTEILHDMEEVLEHNYNWFYNPEFLKNCWQELSTNLAAAITSKP